MMTKINARTNSGKPPDAGDVRGDIEEETRIEGHWRSNDLEAVEMALPPQQKDERHKRPKKSSQSWVTEPYA